MRKIKNLFGSERWVGPYSTSGSICVAYPGSYKEASSSLGYHFALVCGDDHSTERGQRTFSPSSEPLMRTGSLFSPLRLMESGRGVGSMKAIYVSVAYELQVIGFFEILRETGMELIKEKRSSRDPVIIVGGACTLSNPDLFVPFADAVVVGDGENIIDDITAQVIRGKSKAGIVEWLAQQPSVIAGKSDIDSCSFGLAPLEKLPVHSAYVSPSSVFKDMFLVEIMRGCPHSCAFCVMRSKRTREKTEFIPAEKVLLSIPPWASRVGLVGASVLDHPEIDDILAELTGRPVQLGLSSMRAGRLDERRAEMLAAGGVSTVTVAIDSPSRRIRKRIKKPVGRQHIVQAARNVRRAGIGKLKLYALVGYEDEGEEDYEELADLCRELSSIISLSVSLAPVVPKKLTPLENMEFVTRKKYRFAAAFLKKRMKRASIIKTASYRDASLEHILSHCDYASARDLARTL